ncbi:hypothetical protein [Enterococcus casseliflavus]|uniref:hypothetical protein n=1 Tax=Enterococcus casseliflavus TaxID=37734 RepID=UPI00188452D6|nr:hypothetical protein [Enterococcus casseliflavus]MBE9907194.1 hypothetical protein [Enterococcus casseliflavus]
MSYLNHSEYREIGYSSLTEDEFNELVNKACDLIDVQTRNFYQFNDLESDIDFRKKKFKKSVAAQIEYMYQANATSTLEINSPQSWSVDGMSVTEASRYNNTGANESPSIVSDDAILLLSGTGLLNRGIR